MGLGDEAQGGDRTMSDSETTGVEAAIIERLRTAADSYLDCTFEEDCRCIYCEAVAEIEALRAAVLSLGEFVMEIDRNPCDHAWEYLSDPAEIAAAKRAENGRSTP